LGFFWLCSTKNCWFAKCVVSVYWFLYCLFVKCVGLRIFDAGFG